MYDTKELDELLYALAKVMNSGKASIDDDGKITFTDAFNFVDDVVPVWNGIAGAQLIIVNINQITAEQKEVSKAAFFAELNFPPADEAAFDNVLTLLFSLVAVLASFGVIPAVVSTASAPEESVAEEDAVSNAVADENTTEESSENQVSSGVEDAGEDNVAETPSTEETPTTEKPPTEE